MHLCLLKSHLSCPAVFIYFVLNFAQSSGKKKKKAKDYCLFLCFIIHGKGSSEKGLILNCAIEIYLISNGFSGTDCVSCLQARN